MAVRGVAIQAAIQGANVPVIVARGSTQTSYTGGTGEQTLATITLPANSMGPNGIAILTFQMSYAGSGGNRTPRAYFGGTKYYESAMASTNVSARGQVQIQNRNATNSQVGNGYGQVNFSGTAIAVGTSSVDTTAAVTILITGQLANAGDTIAIESYTLEVIYGA